jgi:acetyl esterase/lipase
MSRSDFLKSFALLTASLLPASFGVSQTAETLKPLTRAQILQKLDPQMAEVILLFDAIKGTPITDLTPQDARQQFSTEDAGNIIARGVGEAEAPMPVGKVEDGLTIDGPDGNQIPIRIYTPSGTGTFPVTLYFHGGGFVIATIDTVLSTKRRSELGATQEEPLCIESFPV